MDQTWAVRRRTLLRASGVALGALAMRGYSSSNAGKHRFTHGVASGDPLNDRVILWTRVLPKADQHVAVHGQWQVALDPDFANTVSEGSFETSVIRDYTVKIDATALQPATRYYYRFLTEDAVSPVGRTRTMPMGQVSEFRLAVCSCSNFPQGFFNAYRDIAECDVDLVLHLGDYIYEYDADTYTNTVAVETLGRAVIPSHEIIALEDYRQRYGLYRSDPDLQAAHAAHPWITVWDDHELANDTWRAGAENHQEHEGDFAARMAIARRVYHEWMPIRTPAHTDQGPIYRQFSIGDLADLIMLDTRLQGRDKPLSYLTDLTANLHPEDFRQQSVNNPKRSMLGANQYQWLGTQLAASRDRGAVWQVLGQQVLMGQLGIPQLTKEQLDTIALPAWARANVEKMLQLAPFGLPLNLDAWDGYTASRERVFKLLKDYQCNGVVLAGDTHNAWAFNLSNATGDPVAVEVGCPGISSPGLESYFPLPPEVLARALKDASPQLVALDTYRRGWANVTLTPTALKSCWRFVDTVLSRDYSVTESVPLVCIAGDNAFRA